MGTLCRLLRDRLSIVLTPIGDVAETDADEPMSLTAEGIGGKLGAVGSCGAGDVPGRPSRERHRGSRRRQVALET